VCGVTSTSQRPIATGQTQNRSLKISASEKREAAPPIAEATFIGSIILLTCRLSSDQ
jgi:hypothetical protein